MDEFPDTSLIVFDGFAAIERYLQKFYHSEPASDSLHCLIQRCFNAK